jgi:uncharacterized cupin superfamily protein
VRPPGVRPKLGEHALTHAEREVHDELLVGHCCHARGILKCKHREVRKANVFNAEFEYDPEDPAGYKAGMARVGEAAGGSALAVKLYELAPGENLCPYHYEYEEEWLLVLEGAVILRVPEGERQLQRGDLVCFPPGPEGAHKVTNREPEVGRVLMFSSAHEPAVAVYPDSDKIGVWPGNPDDRVMLRRADGHVEYYDGES